MLDKNKLKNLVKRRPEYISLIGHILNLGEKYKKFSAGWLSVKSSLYNLPTDFKILENIGVLKYEEKFSSKRKTYYSVPNREEIIEIMGKNSLPKEQKEEIPPSPKEVLKKWLNTTQCMDCIEGMNRLPNNSIDLMVTSPPYDKIRDYSGFKYNLHNTGKQVYRLLKEGGIAVMVIQDQTKNYGKTLTSFKMTIDWCENIGFKLFECLIYKKYAGEGAWWNKRFRVDHEYMPVFLKGKRPQYFNKEPLKIPSKWGGKTLTGGATRLTNGQTLKAREIKINPLKCRGTIWEYLTAGDGSQLKHLHPATYPDKLPDDFIQCFCPENGIVLDPFMGSGTTAISAKKLKRDFIGFDISKEYCELTELRLKNEIKPIQKILLLKNF